MTKNAVEAAKIAAGAGIGTRVIRLVKISPLPFDDLKRALENINAVIIVEEGIKNGGIGERICAGFAQRGINKTFSVAAIDGVFPVHGNNSELFDIYGLSAEKIAGTIIKAAGDET